MNEQTAEIAKQIIDKGNLDFGIKVLILVVAFAVILKVIQTFMIKARIESIGLGGIKADPEDDAKPKAPAKKKLFTRKKV